MCLSKSVKGFEDFFYSNHIYHNVSVREGVKTSGNLDYACITLDLHNVLIALKTAAFDTPWVHSN